MSTATAASVASETVTLDWKIDHQASTKYQGVTSAHDDVTGLTYAVIDYHHDGIILYVTFASEETGTVIMDRGIFENEKDARVAAGMLQGAHRATLAAVGQMAQSFSVGPREEFGYRGTPPTQPHHTHQSSQFGFVNARVNGK